MPEHFLQAFTHPGDESPIGMEHEEAEFPIVQEAKRSLLGMQRDGRNSA
jgi:hypothetical protein